jgi:hypothetical protein
MNELRELANRAWRNGNHRVGAALDGAADALHEADELAAQARAHRIAATAHLDQLQAHACDLDGRVAELLGERQAAHPSADIK